MRKKILLSAMIAGSLLMSGCSDTPGVTDVKKGLENGNDTYEMMTYAATNNQVDGMLYLHEDKDQIFSARLYAIALKSDAKDVFKLLYDNNVQVEEPRSLITTILNMNIPDKTIKMLEERGLVFSEHRRDILNYAINHQSIRFLETALNMSPSLSKAEVRKLFHNKLGKLNIKTAEALIKAGDIDLSKGYFLDPIITEDNENNKGMTGLFVYLVDHGAKLNSANLTSALQSHNNTIVRKMIEKGIKFNQRFLWIAFNNLNAETIASIIPTVKKLDITKAMCGSVQNQQHGIEILKKVTSSGIKLNNDCLVSMYEQYNPSLPDSKKWLTYYKQLIENGADINHQRTKDGQAVVHIAAKIGDIEMLKYITAKEGLFNLTYSEGWSTESVLDSATRKRSMMSRQKPVYYSDTIRYLFQHHAKDIINSVSSSHAMALLENNDLDSFKKLADAGLSFKHPSGKTWNLRRYADENKPEVYAFLKQYNLI